MGTGKRLFSTVPVLCVLAAALLLPAGLFAQQSLKVTAEEIECLPIGDNGVGWARVENNVPDTTVRLNFRRMHDQVEDMYYVDMNPNGEGRYWGIFPKAEDRVLDRHDLQEKRDEYRDEYLWAQWWRAKQSSDHRDPNNDLDEDLIRERASLGKHVPRDWFNDMDDETFENWLEQLENEPAEYFTSVHDATGEEIARSKTKVVEVRDNCRLDLTPQERGEAENLTVGEYAHWQQDEEIFHWLCDGVVSRVNPLSILRGDGVCRVCVIAWWKKPHILIPATTAAVAGGVLHYDDDDGDIVSRSVP